ncbi:hypothetical protein I4U23_030616 [Adineta vaga]|nr:hypothetical protein I4U23_030616 [Adineta vaga]
MATPPTLDLVDFTCSICREIFENPVSLSCSHNYCRRCLDGLKKSSSSSTTDLTTIPKSEPSPKTATLIYKPKLHEADACFICAICRTEVFGYYDCRDLEADLKTLEAPCSICDRSLVLCELRRHSEKCKPKKKVDVNDLKNILTPNFLKQLSEPQTQALEKARAGENRSTFQCPYCPRANFTIEHLCRHIEKYHLEDNPRRVCPICAAMPWGNKHQKSSNVYEHIIDRHRFDYSTYVNYEQDEEAMLAEAVQKSMLYH